MNYRINFNLFQILNVMVIVIIGSTKLLYINVIIIDNFDIYLCFQRLILIPGCNVFNFN